MPLSVVILLGVFVLIAVRRIGNLILSILLSTVSYAAVRNTQI